MRPEREAHGAGQTPASPTEPLRVGIAIWARQAPVSRSSPERAKTGYGLGEAKRNSALVATLLAPNLRELALRNQSSPLGCSPWEACTTDHDLDSAIRVVVMQAGAGAGDGDGDE